MKNRLVLFALLVAHLILRFHQSLIACVPRPPFLGTFVHNAGKISNDPDDASVDRDEIYRNIVVFCSLSLISKVFKELQNVIYLGVKQAAYAEIAQQTFAHLHSLSLEWHLKKKMGNILRSMDRGVAAADTVVSYLFLYLGPSVIECFIVFVIFYSHFDLPALSATAFIAFAVRSPPCPTSSSLL